MYANSRRVISNQSDVAPQLRRTARWRCSGPEDFLKPIAEPARSLFTQIERCRRRAARPLILDAGCGTAVSTFRLAKRHPHALVIGIDRSSRRLARYEIGTHAYEQFGNVVLACMDLVDFWRLAARHHWTTERHYLLYPNPWPKHKQWRKRWHAHPVFDAALALGGVLELRSNWPTYVYEFADVVRIKTSLQPRVEHLELAEAISPFEKKYADSGHPRLRLTITLPNS
jgi:tRNA (guanine-N7-)-methyltransferase